jgi:MFS superfamily sulfate permease-like transporter
VGAIAVQGTADFNTLTSTLAILIGAFFLLFGALRMGWMAAFIPTPVMRGFIEGLVCVTIIGQVPHLLGIYRTSHPQGAVLGQLPGTEAYRDVQRHPEALTFPGLLIWRTGGDLFFASIGHLDQGLKAALATHRPPARQLLLDAASVNFIDTSACDAVLNFIKELQSQGIIFAFARVRDDVRERMRLGGIEAAVGPSNFHERVTDGVRAWQQRAGSDATSGAVGF